MNKLLIAAMAALILSGCSAPVKQLKVTETKYVVLEDKHFIVQPLPEPSLSREEAKALDDKAKIKWLTGLYIEAVGHVTILEKQILGIKEAMLKSQEKLNEKD